MMNWKKRALALCMAVLLIAQNVGVSQAVEVSTYWDQISPAVRAFLLANGISESLAVEGLKNVARLAGLTQPEMSAMLTSSGALANPNIPFWNTFVQYVRAMTTEGGIAGNLGMLAARYLALLAMFVVVAFAAYEVGYACGQVLLQQVDPSQATVDANTMAALAWTLQNALASGRWRLRPDLTPQQATLLLLQNVKQNRCPYLANLVVPVNPAPGGFSPPQPPSQASAACPPASSQQNARFMADQYFSIYQRMLGSRGPNDPQTIDAKRLADCYRSQVQ